MDDTGRDVIFGKPTAFINSTEGVASDGDTPVAFKTAIEGAAIASWERQILSGA